MVARDLDVDYGPGGDASGEENGGEFDLAGLVVVVLGDGGGGLTMRFSSVRRMARPASTLPTVSDMSIFRGGGGGNWC